MYSNDLTSIIHCHRHLRHVRRCHQAPIKEFNYNPLLSCNSCHFPTYILKLPLCNHNFIT